VRIKDQRVALEPRNDNKLRWQSWLVLAVVAPVCALATLRHATSHWTRATQTSLAISLGLALLVWLARAATPPAALTGGVITAVLALAPLSPSGQEGSPFHSALPPLLALFLLTFSATKFGRRKKEQLGVAEDKRGRNAAQVAANLGVAGLAAATALSLPSPGPLYAVMVTAALAEATADTLASELGEVLGGPPFMVTTLRRVAPGSDGAVSPAGTVAGTSGAVLVVLVAVFALNLSLGSALCAGLGAIAGLFVDSLLGATAERRGCLNNDAVNFLSTLAAAALAAAALALH
jgi:uncharacterized protein (TIGR00297 family)